MLQMKIEIFCIKLSFISLKKLNNAGLNETRVSQQLPIVSKQFPLEH